MPRKIWMEDMKVFVVKTGGPIYLDLQEPYMTLCPIEAHIKPDGDVNDRPSVAFVLLDADGIRHVAEVSARMLKPLFEELQKLEKNNGHKVN